MYQQILSALPYPCSIISKDYTYLALNDAYSELYSQQITNIKGKKVSDILSNNLFISQVKPMIDKALNGEVVEYEVEINLENQNPKVMKMIYTPYKDEKEQIIGILSIGEDISSKKMLEKEASFNESYFNSVFTKNPHITISTNGEELDKGNQQMLEFVGYESVDAFKKDYDCICDLFLEGEGLLQAQMGEDRWLEYILKNRNKSHYVQMNKDEKTYDFIVNANPINLDQFERSIVSFSDITELKQTQKLLHEQEELLIAQSRHAAMGEMLSIMAHEWRQPISVISMIANNILLDVQLDEVSNKNLHEYAESINSYTVKLSKTIDDFSSLFKPMQEKESTTANELCIDTYAIIGKSIENNGINFLKNCNSDCEFTTYKGELMQVLINILKNSKEILIEREIKNPTIQCNLEESDNSLLIQISDNGGGVSEDIIDKIFDPYFTTKGLASGIGLGLYISKIIVEQHIKGTIGVHNTKEGACFSITVPI